MEEYERACQAINGRDEAKARAAERIEVGMQILGVTGIEDSLQDEVPETIRLLKEAGIVVWVLTGDKVETAINIGYSCRLLHDGMKELYISGESFVALRHSLTEALNFLKGNHEA